MKCNKKLNTLKKIAKPTKRYQSSLSCRWILHNTTLLWSEEQLLLEKKNLPSYCYLPIFSTLSSLARVFLPHTSNYNKLQFYNNQRIKKELKGNKMINVPGNLFWSLYIVSQSGRILFMPPILHTVILKFSYSIPGGHRIRIHGFQEDVTRKIIKWIISECFQILVRWWVYKTGRNSPCITKQVMMNGI